LWGMANELTHLPTLGCAGVLISSDLPDRSDQSSPETVKFLAIFDHRTKSSITHAIQPLKFRNTSAIFSP